MANFDVMKEVAIATPSKIVLLVADGLGGLPREPQGRTELETANTPNLDRLAQEGLCGLIDPVSPGITPGSGPAHLSLFGYDPVKHQIGRGVLEALGIDFPLESSDVAVRGNFCTVNDQGLITDRRAGRIPTEESTKLVELLSHIQVEGAQVFVRPVREHRFVLVFRGRDLSGNLADTDPQKEGLPPRPVEPLSPGAVHTAQIANQFVARARELLAGRHPANMILLRGFSKHPALPTMQEIYRLRPAAIAVYPMYRGLAKLVGMEVVATGSTIQDEMATLAEHWGAHDFFFIHYKKTDSAGEDGAFDRKVAAIEELDAAIPSLMRLQPDVVVVTGDHSTPAALRAHSWHPVPLLLRGPWERADPSQEFGESACARGLLGRFPSTEVMPLAMAHALKLGKFGA